MNERILTPVELDTIGEVLNISMGAAATAVSTMLDRQVLITTPKITQNQLNNLDFTELEPAVVVKIDYVKGLSGTNMIVLRRRDMGTILNILMGNDFLSGDDFEFDEMSLSAACEVMNQMMGSAATAMSEMLGKPINISTPQSLLVDGPVEHAILFENADMSESVVEISFKMSIKETLDTTFSSIMPLALCRDIVESLNGGLDMENEPVQPVTQTERPAQSAPAPMASQSQVPPTPQVPPAAQAQVPPPPQVPPAEQPQVPAQPPQGWAPGMAPGYPPIGESAGMPYGMDPAAYPYPPYQPAVPPYGQPYGQPYPPYGQPFVPPYGQPPYGQAPYGQPAYGQPPAGQAGQAQDPNGRYVMPSLNVKQAEFPDFANKTAPVQAGFTSNMNMLMGVQLEVSVVIGRSKQKIKDVLDFGQGSVIELDKQTGSPAEIVVNGQLIAYGDVVVVGDNFGVRITEIVGTDELIDSLEKGNK